MKNLFIKGERHYTPDCEEQEQDIIKLAKKEEIILIKEGAFYRAKPWGIEYPFYGIENCFLSFYCDILRSHLEISYVIAECKKTFKEDNTPIQKMIEELDSLIEKSKEKNDSEYEELEKTKKNIRSTVCHYMHTVFSMYYSHPGNNPFAETFKSLLEKNSDIFPEKNMAEFYRENKNLFAESIDGNIAERFKGDVVNIFENYRVKLEIFLRYKVLPELLNKIKETPSLEIEKFFKKNDINNFFENPQNEDFYNNIVINLRNDFFYKNILAILSATKETNKPIVCIVGNAHIPGLKELFAKCKETELEISYYDYDKDDFEKTLTEIKKLVDATKFKSQESVTLVSMFPTRETPKTENIPPSSQNIRSGSPLTFTKSQHAEE